jgi:ABC-type branched-subunit amino acid transport system substrate-binding protein
MGHLISQGAILAVEDINADGGVLGGRNLTLLIEDDATNPATGFEAYKKLVEVNGVEVIVGPMISGGVMACGNYAAEMQVPMVSPSATSPLVTDQPHTDWDLRTCTTDYLQGGVLAKMITDAGLDKAAILVQDTPYGIGIEQVVTGILEDAGVEIVKSIRYDSAKLDYLTELQEIKDANPDAIIHVGYHTDGAVVYEQADSLGLDTIKWMVSEGVYGLPGETYPAAAAFMAKPNFRGCTLAADPELPAYVAFKAAYEARWDEPPGVYCDTVYDAVKLIAKAIDEAGAYNGTAIKDALYEVGVNYNGASGVTTFDATGDRIHATYGIWKLQFNEETEEYEYVILQYIPL